MADFLNTAFDFYKDKLGYAPHQAAAMAGNIMSEGPAGPTQLGDGGLAVGRFQWHPPRQDNLFKWAKENNLDPMTDEAQMRFADWELRNTEKAAGDKFFASKDLTQANDAMMHYLRPAGYVPDNPAGGGGYVNRYNLGAGLINQPAMAQVLATPPSKNIGFGPQPAMQMADSAMTQSTEDAAKTASGDVPKSSVAGLLAQRQQAAAFQAAQQSGMGLMAAGAPQQTWQPSPMSLLQAHRPEDGLQLPNFRRRTPGLLG